MGKDLYSIDNYNGHVLELKERVTNLFCEQTIIVFFFEFPMKNLILSWCFQNYSDWLFAIYTFDSNTNRIKYDKIRILT